MTAPSVVYNTITEPGAGFDNTLGLGNFVAFSFMTGASAVSLQGLQLYLRDTSPNDGGTLTVTLCGDVGGEPGTSLEVIGTVQDASLTLAGSAVTVPTTAYPLSASTRYWIKVSSSTTSHAGLGYEGNGAGTGTANQYYTYTGAASASADSTGAYLAEVTVACYARGTAIRTPHGDRPVEDLTPGDVVVTALGERRAICWIGRRGYSGAALAANPGVQPIRLRAGSLGAGLPRRDLLVSPEHAMFIDGLLIPARCLVNGASIVKERGLESIDYFHVELDTHDVLLAEGAPSESFYDDDSRGVFENAAECGVRNQDAARRDGYCAPRVEQGAALEAI